MQSASSKVKTGGRKAGTPNKATAARAAGVLSTSNARAPARGADGAADDPDFPGASAFPRYRLARVDDLVPYEKNPRTHSPAQIDLIARLVTEFGFTNPVLVDGKRGVIAGHGRVLAAKSLGMAVVPTIELSHLSAAQKRAYVIADNQSALKAGWDDDLLRLELGALRDNGFDLALTGFDALDLDGLFGAGIGGNTDPDDVPEVQAEAVSRLGDVWVMGRHRLMCGDCTDAGVVEVAMNGRRAELCLTDPPYGIGEDYTASDDTEAELSALIPKFLPLLRENCDVVLLTPGNKHHRLYPRPEWELAWFVPAGTGAGPWGFCCWQPVLAFGRDPFLRAGKGSRPDALCLTESAENDLAHPCPKPVKVWTWFMERGSLQSTDTILDPFAGSGTTIIAAEQTGRVCVACEISPNYCDVAVRRWQQFTGQSATLEHDGRAFDAVSWNAGRESALPAIEGEARYARSGAGFVYLLAISRQQRVRTGGSFQDASAEKVTPSCTPNSDHRAAPARGADGAADDPDFPGASAFPRYRLARVDDLVPYEKNPRTHSPAQIDLIARLVTEFGFTNPVLVDGKRGVIAGHGRVLAAKSLGMAVVPTIELSHLSAAQKRAYVIADNQSALKAGWDDDLLRLELGALRDNGFDLALTGFDALDLDGLFGAGIGGNTDPDDVPEVQAEAVSRLGDVWVMGRHRLMCGDCTDAGVVDAVLAGSAAQMVFTDPPYGVDYTGGMKPRERLNGDHVGTDIYAESLRHLAFAADDKAALYLWYADGHAAAAAAAAAGYQIVAQIIWAKNHAQFVTSAHYKGKHEPCFYAHRRGKAARWHGPNNEVTLWECDRAARNDYHPTQKPVALAQRAMQNSSESGQIVLDMFVGGGTTIIAAEMTGRVCHAIEIEPRYVDVSIRRWQSFTGADDAVLEATGETFAEVAAARLLEAAA